MKAVNLKTEYLKNPIGIDIKCPRLFWNCEGGIKQTAYIVSLKKENGGEIWKSEKIFGNEMHFDLPFDLKSRQRVYWNVTLFDENGNIGEMSETAFFETGLYKKDWEAEWITGNYDVNKKSRYPVDCFLKKFAIKKEVERARLYISACGIYCAVLNGERFSMPLAPGITDYRRRVQYQTYDIAPMLKHMNTLEIQLADGWYRGSTGAWGLVNQYGTETKLVAQLEMKFADGEMKRIATDGTWAWSNDGEIRFADNQDGEIVDARMIPSYGKFAKVTSHNVIPTCSNNVPIAEKETFKPIISKTPSGKTLLEFPQNMAGYISFTLNAKAGEKLKLRFGEMLDDGGELTLKNIQCSNKKKTTPLQKIEYICKDGENKYKTKFAIFGFEYVEVETDIDLTNADFTAIAVYSDFEETGFFESSNELLNKFVQATKWSTKSNSADLPTDCPTRERHGWTGDAQIFVNTASWLFNYMTFARKFEDDLCDEQKRNGCFRQIAPMGGVDFYMTAMDGSPGWSDAGVLIPYRLYKKYDDKRILQKYYGNMRRYTMYKIRSIGKWYPTALPTGVGIKNIGKIVNYGQSYGEWAEPTDVRAFAINDFVSPHPEETTAYVVYLLEHMEKIAKILGDSEDEKLYKKYADKVKDGYRVLVKSKKFSLDTDRQAKLVRPLYMDLLDKKQKEYAKNRLIKALENYGWRLGTGFLSTPLILDVLADIDIEYAYRLLENENMPGWLFMTKMGSTTIWESWEGTKAQGGIASLNHYSKGAVCEWLFKGMCGIKIDGKNHFIIRLLPGGHFTFANAAYKSVFGEVKSGWKKENGRTIFKISIPSNCTADVILPNGESKNVTAGKYSFEM